MNLVGSSRPIHDAAQKAMGRAIYAGDMVLPGMLHCAVVFSTVPHGVVRSVDASEALAMPGVRAVLSCFDTTDRRYNRFRILAGQETIEQDGIFNRHVRFVGDRLACVVAESAVIARRAARRVRVEYDELPFTTDISEAMSGKISNIHEEGAVYGDTVFDMGEASPSEEGEVEVATTSVLSRISHVAMEPHACVADYSPETGELTVWSPNQSVHGIRTVMSSLFDIPCERIRVVKTTMGGSFGGKQEWVLEPVAIAASMRVGAPVKLVYTRGEAMVSTISRSPMEAVVKTRVTPDGRIRDMEADVSLNAGACVGNSRDYMGAMGGKFYRCYDFGHVRYTARTVCTNTPLSGAFRGWGAPEIFIMIEHNLNMAARKIGMDPLELRLKNVALPGGVDKKNGQPLGEIRIRECIELGRESFDWRARREADAAFNARGGRFRRGTGIGCGGHVNGYFPRFQDFTGVEMRMTESGGVIVNCTLHDHGCGTLTAIRTIAAETLGINPEAVSLREADTAYTPADLGCFASRTTYVIGRAVVDCAGKLKEDLASGVAELHGIDASVVSVADGFVSAKNGEIRYTFAEASTKIIRELQRETWVKHQYVNSSNPGVTGAHFAHVEVDTYTGMTEILDYLAVHDIGRAINRGMCVAQIQGAVLMGAGGALEEHLRVNAQNGRPIASLKDYHVINAPSAPQIRVELIEDGGTEGPFGAKSIGEVCHVPVAPSIIGAVNEALGSEICAIPIDPDAIVRLMAERRAGR